MRRFEALKEEGAGSTGCRRTRSLVCNKKAHELVTTGTPKQSGAVGNGLRLIPRSPRSAGLDSLRRLPIIIDKA